MNKLAKKGMAGFDNIAIGHSAVNQHLNKLELAGYIRVEGGQGKKNQIIYIL